MTDAAHDLLVTGGHLVDPEHGIDAPRDVAVRDGRISWVGPAADAPSAHRRIDANGLLVTPGFIDLHSHAQDLTGHRLQALDGVTTSLELESGATPVSLSLDWARREGRPLHHGYAAGWLHARVIVLEDLSEEEVAAWPPLPLDSWAAVQGGRRWRDPAGPEAIGRIVELVEAQLDAGAIGIGMLLGYASASTAEELRAIGELAARRRVPLFVHMRSSGPGSSTPTAPDAVAELVDLSRECGVAVHLCHFNSSNKGSVPESAAVIAAARAEGLPVTTEGYPYGLGSTVIGAEFLDPDRMERTGRPASAVYHVAGGRWVESYAELRALREADPGALCALLGYDEDDPTDRDMLRDALLLPDAAFASDAMPVQQLAGAGDGADDHPWPVPESVTVHPRATSCYARALTWLHRDTGLLSLSETVARATSIPAGILRPAVPAMARKGHLGVGADADLTVLDLAELTPSRSFHPVTPTRGVRHVLVDGVAVVEDGALVTGARPGRALTTRS